MNDMATLVTLVVLLALIALSVSFGVMRHIRNKRNEARAAKLKAEVEAAQAEWRQARDKRVRDSYTGERRSVRAGPVTGESGMSRPRPADDMDIPDRAQTHWATQPWAMHSLVHAPMPPAPSPIPSCRADDFAASPPPSYDGGSSSTDSSCSVSTD